MYADPRQSSRDLLLSPLFTLRNQARAESVQIATNPDGTPAPRRRRPLYQGDARTPRRVPARPGEATRITGRSQKHNGTSGMLGRRLLAAPVAQTFLCAGQPDAVIVRRQTRHPVDGELTANGEKRSSWSHVRDALPPPHPPLRVARRCARTLSLSLLLRRTPHPATTTGPSLQREGTPP